MELLIFSLEGLLLFLFSLSLWTWDLPRLFVLSSFSKSFLFKSSIYFCNFSLIFFCSFNCLVKVLPLGSFSYLVCESKWWIWLKFSIPPRFYFYLWEALVIWRLRFSSFSLLFSSSYTLTRCLSCVISWSFTSDKVFKLLSNPSILISCSLIYKLNLSVYF